MQISNTNLVVRLLDVQFLEKLQEGSVGGKASEAGVGSSSVAVPHAEENIFQRLTSGHVKNANI